MFKIAVCDDVAQVCHDIEKILLSYADKAFLDIDVEVFYDGESLQTFIEKEHSFDLIYLDIEMNSLSGLDLSRIIRGRYDDHLTEIVFVSGTTSYDRALFDVQPLHFIPKPIDEAMVIEDLKLALRKQMNTEKTLTLRMGKETVRLPLKDILYIESRGRQITVITMSKHYTCYAALKNLSAQLPECFCRIHHSYIVNLHLVTAFQRNSVTLPGDIILPVSDSYRKEYLSMREKELFGDELP